MPSPEFIRGPLHHSRGPVVGAYVQTGALERDCPNPKCGKPHGEYCVHEDGKTLRRMPCPQRLPHNPDTGGDQ